MTDMSLHLVPVLPLWVSLLLATALLGMVVHGSITLLQRQVPRRWVIGLAALRVGIVAVFTLILLQPVVSGTRSAERRPEMLVLVDGSESMAQPGTREGVSRLQESLRVMNDSGLAASLERQFDLHWFAFDRGATVVDDMAWTRLQPTGSDTRYADSLTQAWSYPRSAETVMPERVLLVSDGRDRGSPDIVETARRFGVAIDVLVPGSPPATNDPAAVAIADVQGASRVLLGSETHFLVTLRGERAAVDRPVTVRLTEGGKDLQSAEVLFRAGRTEEQARMAHRPTEAGPCRCEFHIDKGPSFPLSFQVVDGKHEVLVLEDTWRWEFKFLRRVLEEDPSFRFTALLSRGNGAFMEFAAPDRRTQLIGFPQNRAQLAAFDTVIVGDVDPRRWPTEMAAALRWLVTEEGKSVVVLAGPNQATWTQAPDLLTLLPVEISRETGDPVAGPMPVRVTAEGKRSPFFLQPGAEAAAPVFPALDQIYPPLRKKPAATVLMEAAKLGNANGPLIVMAEQTVGRGRVLYVGTDTLWKWQTLTTAADKDTTPYHLFWQQTLRALAPTRPSGAAVNLWLQPRRSRCEAGQHTTVRAMIETTEPLAQPSVRGLVSLPDGRTLPLSFAADPTEPNAFVADIATGPPGAYRLSATVLVEGRPAGDASTALEADEPRPERDGAPVDAANLARIAAATGGKVLDPADPQTWPMGTAKPWTVRERVTLDLWNRSYLLFLLAAIAGTDWLLRLLRGYV